MAIDFDNFLDDDDEKVIPPRDIFFTLNRSGNFSFPRDIQTEVLNSWYKNRDKPDNVIKLNVGSGKTLVGLLVLQSSLNESCGPALYVAPDKQLVKQVLDEANSLGIDVTTNPRSPEYLSGEKICVINVYRLFNGKSIFGMVDDIKIGSVIIDDAHACISTITNQFRIRLDCQHEAYKKVFNILSEDLKGYHPVRYLDIQSGDPRAYMEVPFWSWQNHNKEIIESLHAHRQDSELEFSFPLISEILNHCRCIIGGQYLEIEPDYPSLKVIKSFRRAKRRIYMTATLADDSVIVTHFGANQQALQSPIVPTSSQSIGERMILMPQELNVNLSLEDIKSLLGELAEKENVVVIVPSRPASSSWEDIADQVLIGDQVENGVVKLKNGHVGLTVLVNRYDGIDLPGPACRVLAIVDLPEVSSYSELIDREVLSSSSSNLRRQIERIEQGMGRGVRSNEDYCAVFLIGAKLIARLRSPEGMAMLTPATKAQLDLTRRIAKDLKSPSLEELKNVVLQCLNRDKAWITVSKKILVNLQPDNELRLDAASIAIKEALDFVDTHQYDKALSVLDAAINSCQEDQVRAWLLAKKASFQHAVDADGAQKTLAAAYKLESSVLKPMKGASYKKLTPNTGQQASSLIQKHQARFIDPTQMKLFADALCTDLSFRPDSSDTFEAAVNDLAWFLGIEAQRPEKLYNDGPDNLWAFPNGNFLVIECKNEVTSNSGISKKNAAQLDHSRSWFSSRYQAVKYTPVMIHPKYHLGVGANLIDGMRVMDDEKLQKLKGNIREFAIQLCNPAVFSNPHETSKRLAQFKFNGDEFVEAYTKKAVKN